MAPDELKLRTKAFALRIIKVCEALPRTPAARVTGAQLLRAGTAVGANCRSACRSRSPAEFIARMGVVEEESDESAYWIELISEAGLMSAARLAPPAKEAVELCRIASGSRKTARKRVRRGAQIGNRKSTIGNTTT